MKRLRSRSTSPLKFGCIAAILLTLGLDIGLALVLYLLAHLIFL